MAIDPEVLAWMESLDGRVGNIEDTISVINRELGVLSERVKPSMAPMLIKFVIFPLILIVGGLVGVKIFLPF